MDGRAPSGLRPGCVNPACAAAANIAFEVTIASRLQAILPGVSDGVVLPFNRVFLKCAQLPADPVATTTTRSGASRLPPKPLTPLSVKYPPTLRPHEVNGVVQVRLLVTSAGCASDAETLSSLHPLLDFEALRAVYSTRYSPSTVDGKPESVYLIWNAWFRP
jgi:TonB-like protein